jgi:Holliday junction resolvasome RuvABC endonuclease subunit
MKKVENSILSFDVSSVSTGWCHLVESNVEKFGLIQPPKNFSLQQKLYYFDCVTKAILEMCKPVHVVVEDAYLKNVKTLKTLMQFIGVLNLNCFDVLEIDLVFISTMSVRSKFSLKTKEQVFYFIKKLYRPILNNYVFEDGNDISDSILQALYYYKFVLTVK